MCVADCVLSYASLRLVHYSCESYSFLSRGCAVLVYAGILAQIAVCVNQKNTALNDSYCDSLAAYLRAR